MRCQDCGKFVSYEDPPTVEVGDWTVEGIESVLGSVRVALLCAECGSELKDTELDFVIDFDHDCDQMDDATTEIEVNDITGEGTSRFENTYRGKVVPGRYWRTFYGAELTASCHCPACDENFTVTTTVDEQASSFNEL
jgi:hypothetical protein